MAYSPIEQGRLLSNPEFMLLAQGLSISPARLALAWLLAQRPWIAPIPGTRRIERVEENAAAATVALSADEVALLNALTEQVPVSGNRYNDAGMAMVGR